MVPLTHETHPLAPVLELGLTLTSSHNPKIIGAYFANPSYQDKRLAFCIKFIFLHSFSLSPYAARLAERIASVNNITPLLVQVKNWKLSPDCPENCLTAHTKDGDAWKEAQ